MGSCTFLPPGKVADFCGFQYMRDVDTNELGHNTSFVPRAANNVLYVLTTEQKAQLVALAKEQEKILTDFAYKRFPLIKAFCRQLEGDVPAGSAGLNREAVMKYTAGLFEIDGLLSYRRAEVLGGIIRSLTDQQKEYLAKMAFNNSATWPDLPDQLDKRSLSHTAHVAVMTYASEMFSWYAGNVEADVYFCPERHATYFGSFYMKDIPAMGNPNFSISTSLTGDSGEAFLAALTEPQRRLVTHLVDQQRGGPGRDRQDAPRHRHEAAAVHEGAIPWTRTRSWPCRRRYGELDGEISYFYATAFAEVAKTLTADQKKTLLKLRNLDAKYVCRGAYLYSRAIDMPEIPNTDFLFAASAAALSSSAAPTATTAESGFVLRSPAVAGRRTAPAGIHRRRRWCDTAPGVERDAAGHPEPRRHHAPCAAGRRNQVVLDPVQHSAQRVEPARERPRSGNARHQQRQWPDGVRPSPLERTGAEDLRLYRLCVVVARQPRR